MAPEEIAEEVCHDARQIGMNFEADIRQYRVVNRPDDFYSLAAGMEALRPGQETPIRGLTLAGDYTKQEYFATMEGAVISGNRAAELVRRRLD